MEEMERMRRESAALDDLLRGEVAKYRKANRVSVERLSQMMGLCKATMMSKLRRPETFRLSEIRQLQHGAYTVGDGMRRHLVSLERERQNLEAAIRFCGTLTDRRERLEELDAQSLLDRMAQMEQEGTTFMNKQKQDTRRRRFVAPIVVAIVMSVLMAGLIWLFLWAFEVDPAGAPPLPVLALFVAIPAAVVVGVVIALVQRVREIERGEEDDARNY